MGEVGKVGAPGAVGPEGREGVPGRVGQRGQDGELVGVLCQLFTDTIAATRIILSQNSKCHKE